MTNKYEKTQDLIDFITNPQRNKDFNAEIDRKTKHYQKIYGFDISSDPNHPTWNNEADAFKHAFMQAVLSRRYNDFISNSAGLFHEYQNLKSKNPKDETNMDIWNNNVGRDIANEVKDELKLLKGPISENQIEDMYAKKIMERMKAGDLITTPKDERAKPIPKKLQEYFKNSHTGYAVPFTREQINSMTNDEFSVNESSIMSQLKNGLIGSELKDYTGYTNPTSGDNKIFTREDIAQMTTDEYTKYEKDINSQLNSVGIPTKAELSSSSGTVFVNGYTRDDGTEVKSYYRSKPSK